MHYMIVMLLCTGLHLDRSNCNAVNVGPFKDLETCWSLVRATEKPDDQYSELRMQHHYVWDIIEVVNGPTQLGNPLLSPNPVQTPRSTHLAGGFFMPSTWPAVGPPLAVSG